MFILDIQGDQKGLSIGGLVVVTKSLSITVRPLFFFLCHQVSIARTTSNERCSRKAGRVLRTLYVIRVKLLSALFKEISNHHECLLCSAIVNNLSGCSRHYVLSLVREIHMGSLVFLYLKNSNFIGKERTRCIGNLYLT